MKKAGIFLVACMWGLIIQAQSYPIEVTISVLPPYPANLDAYVDYLEQNLVQITNSTNQAMDVYFEASFQETSGRVSVKSNGLLGPAIRVEPGINLLSPGDIRDLFADIGTSDFDINGLSREQIDAILLNRQIPEGEYQLCLRAFDEMGQPLSDPSQGCTQFPVTFPERPQIMMPFDGQVLDTLDPTIQVAWTQVLNDPEAQMRTHFILKILDLTEQNISNVENAMLDPGISPEYEEDLDGNFSVTLQNDIDLPLVSGHRYAIRVTAYDPDGIIGYQFGGQSELVTFYYGPEVQEKVPENEQLAAPTILAPASGGYLATQGSLPYSWDHELEDPALNASLQYSLKVVDMDTQKITSIERVNFENGDYDYLWEIPVRARDSVLTMDPEHPLVKNHQYAMILQVESPHDDRIQFENEGFSPIVQFIYGEEPKIDSSGCGGECLTSLPVDQIEEPIKRRQSYFMGKLALTVSEVSKDNANGGYQGTGYVTINFMGNIKVQVAFTGMKANKGKFVFAGEAHAIYDESTARIDGLATTAGSTLLDMDFEQAKTLSTALRTSGKLVSALAGKETKLPLGFDRDVDGDKMIVGITDMIFTPRQATMTAMMSLENPDWGQYVPALGATNICFTQTGFGSDVKLFLARDYAIETGQGTLTLKASDTHNSGNVQGSYVTVDCSGFKEGQLTAELPVPRSILIPEDETGNLIDGNVKLTLSGTFQKASNYLLSASISPCQLPGLEGFSFELKNGYYDASDLSNPPGIVFPQGYARQATDKTWKGIWFEQALIKAPMDWLASPSDERLTAGIRNFIKDDVGISVAGVAEHLLSIDKGSLEGFAVSIDALNLDIIRGDFKQVRMTGRLGLPILPEGSFLNYEGVIDRAKSTATTIAPTNAVNPDGPGSTEPLQMAFIVKPDQEGYDLDWLKAHIDFDETSQFILKNDKTEKGFSAQLAGKISLKMNLIEGANAARDAGTPAIELPGIRFEGMELSRMTRKSNTTQTTTASASQATPQSTPGKASPLIFKRPVLSLTGINLKDLTGNTNQIPGQNTADAGPASQATEPEAPESPARMNGFSLNLDKVEFTFGESGQEQEEVTMTDGLLVNLEVQPSVILVGGQNKTTTGSQTADKKQEGFAITAKGAFTISSRVKSSGSGYSLAYDAFRLDSFSIEGELKAIEIAGKLGFYNSDPDFGNGMLGNLEVKMPLVDVRLDARFGNKPDYTYWYLFGDLEKGGTSTGPPTPLFVVGQYLQIYGFNGGAYYHMKEKQPFGTPEQRYTPDNQTLLGLRAGLTFSITQPQVFWAKTALQGEFNGDGGINNISLAGEAYMLQPEMKEQAPGELDGIKIDLAAKLNIKGEETTFDANLDIYANVAQGLITGAMPGGKPNQVVTSTMHVDADKWSLLMGRPSLPGLVRLQLPGINYGVDAKAYLMMGNGVAFEEARLDPFITGLFNRGTDGKFQAARVSGKQQTRESDGFAIGMSLDYKLDIQASILYANFRAMFGFDLSLLNHPGVTCRQSGEAIGMAGYYANGQVYAGLEGDIGLDVDLWFYTGKFSLAKIYAVMLIQGGLPNPIWVKGQARMGYEVLGGLLKGNTSFSVKLGEKCEEIVSDPFAGVHFIADMDPGSGTKDVSVFVNPRVSFENHIGKYDVPVSHNDAGVATYRNFDVRMASFTLINLKSNRSIPASLETSADLLSSTLRIQERLEPYTTYKTAVTLQVYEWVNGTWALFYDPKTNQPLTEYKEVAFQTGALPNYITLDNVKLVYPFKDESYYLQDENKYKQGLMEVALSTGYLFQEQKPAGEQWFTKVIARITDLSSQQKFETAISTYNGGTVYTFGMPDRLANNTQYQVDFVRIPYQNTNYNLSGNEIADRQGRQGDYVYITKGQTYQNYISEAPPEHVIFSYKFKTSKYNSLYQKVNFPTTLDDQRNSDLAVPRVTYRFQNQEYFSHEELIWRYLTDNQVPNFPTILVKEDYATGIAKNAYRNLFEYFYYSMRVAKYYRQYSQEKNYYPAFTTDLKFNNDDNVYLGLKDQYSTAFQAGWGALQMNTQNHVFNSDLKKMDWIIQYLSNYPIPSADQGAVNVFTKITWPTLFNSNLYPASIPNLTDFRITAADHYTRLRPANSEPYRITMIYNTPYFEAGKVMNHQSYILKTFY